MLQVRRRPIWLGTASLLCLAGCAGGGHGPSGSGGGTSQTSAAGEAVFTYFGQPKPMATSSYGAVSVLSQAGATFSTVTLEPPANLDGTYLAFARAVNNEWLLYKYPYVGGDPQLLYQNNEGSAEPGISAYGSTAFVSNVASYTIRPDGTGLKSLVFSGVSACAWPACSVDGTNRLAFTDGEGHLYIGPGTGGAATLVQSNDTGQYEAWNTAGTELAYTAHVGTGSNTDIFVTPTNGSFFEDVTPSALVDSGLFENPTWNADGVPIAAMYEPSGSSTFEIIKFNINDISAYSIFTGAGDYEQEPSFSPDGLKLAFYRDNTDGATPGIYISDAGGVNALLVIPDPSSAPNSVYGGLQWSPFLPKETVVGSSGSTFYHQSASGFMLSQVNNQFGSFIAFTANTPAGAAIQTPSPTTAYQPMLFTLTADSITQIGYINSYYNPGTTITLTSTPSVVVTVDAGTGQVDLVAPASVAKPASTKNADGMVTYNCNFKAIYDSAGKNLAPSGASQLVVNAKTGRLVSFK